jgi:hypothetical protein
MTDEPKSPNMPRVGSPPTAPKFGDSMRGEDSPKWMSDQNVGRYRAMADECCACAERARYELDRQAWLKLAGDWNALAEGALLRCPA